MPTRAMFNSMAKRVPGPAEVLVPGHDDIRLVHQEYQLMPNVSVRENISYALRFFEKSYRDFRVDELLKLCRLTEVQDRIPRQVSGGEKQRTAIARAIADKPAVLLLDEPFSHLDLPNRLIVRDLLFDMVRRQGDGTGDVLSVRNARCYRCALHCRYAGHPARWETDSTGFPGAGIPPAHYGLCGPHDGAGQYS